MGGEREWSLTDVFDCYIESCLHFEVFIRAHKAQDRDHSPSLDVDAEEHIL